MDRTRIGKYSVYWPDSFVRSACGCRDHAMVGKRRLYLCHSCHRQTSVMAGTVFENSLLPWSTRISMRFESMSRTWSETTSEALQPLMRSGWVKF